MAPRPLAAATISFGLVSIPVKLFTTTKSSESVSFRMLHETCKTPLKYQYYCPKDDETVERSNTVKGYEYAKNQFIVFTSDELKAMEEEATKAIAIEEFVPLDAIDGVYFDKAYYVAPEKGGARAYSLLAKAMEVKGIGGLAKYAARGKQYLVVLRPIDGKLVMQQLRYAHEVRAISEVPLDDVKGDVKDTELKLALQLIEQTTSDSFEPEKYHDEVHDRLVEHIEEKVAGQEISIVSTETPKAKVIDLMDALKASLSGGGSSASAEASEASDETGASAAKSSDRKPAKASARKKAKKAPAKKNTPKKSASG